jgi:Fe-S-cluster containining protein
MLLNDKKVKAILELYTCEHCARCCRRERVTVNQNDIHKNRKLVKAIESNLMVGYCTLKLPCIFIDDSNSCTTYVNRPTACRWYPLFEKYPGMVSVSSCLYGDKIIADLVEYCELNGIPTEDSEGKESVEKWDQMYRNMGVGQEESFRAVSIPSIIFNRFFGWITNVKKGV